MNGILTSFILMNPINGPGGEIMAGYRKYPLAVDAVIHFDEVTVQEKAAIGLVYEYARVLPSSFEKLGIDGTTKEWVIHVEQGEQIPG